MTPACLLHDNNLQFTASLKNHNTLTTSDIHWCHSFVSSTPEGYLVLRELHSAAHIWGEGTWRITVPPFDTLGDVFPVPHGIYAPAHRITDASASRHPVSLQQRTIAFPLFSRNGTVLIQHSRSDMQSRGITRFFTLDLLTINPQNYNLTTLNSINIEQLPHRTRSLTTEEAHCLLSHKKLYIYVINLFINQHQLQNLHFSLHWTKPNLTSYSFCKCNK